MMKSERKNDKKGSTERKTEERKGNDGTGK